MKKAIFFILLFAAAANLSAQTFTEWHDAAVNEINRQQMHVVIHEAPCDKFDVMKLGLTTEHLNKLPLIRIILEENLPAVSSHNDVIIA